MPRRFLKILIGAAILLASVQTLAQEEVQTPQRSYRSEVDDLLTIEKVSVLPFTDNLEGIYARPLETHFISLVETMHRWDYIPATTSGPILSPEELEASPEKAIQVSKGMGVDAFFAGRVTKGPAGITVHVSLFLTKDGKLLSQAILKDTKQFELSEMKEQITRLLGEIVNRLPYSGRVLSRDGNRVTVNLGSRDGLQVGQVLSVIELIQVQRHPKFNFLIHAEKEIFGKIKVLKVDETLSFGAIITEKEKGAIQKNSKTGPLDFVTYSTNDGGNGFTKPEDQLTQREDNRFAFGKDPHAWQPKAAPTFGQIGGRFGIGRLDESLNLYSAGSLSSHDDFAPIVILEGEIWITPEWTFHASLKHEIASVGNPRTGSNISTLNQQLSAYEAGVGYTFRFGPNIWSANLEPFLSYFTSQLYTDQSTPRSFNTMNYSGLKFGLRGMTPIRMDSDYGVGGQFGFGITPGLAESPNSSGASNSNSVTNFDFFVYKKIGERLRAQVNIDLDMYSTSFNGTGSSSEPASSASQQFTTVSGGVYYMF